MLRDMFKGEGHPAGAVCEWKLKAKTVTGKLKEPSSPRITAPTFPTSHPSGKQNPQTCKSRTLKISPLPDLPKTKIPSSPLRPALPPLHKMHPSSCPNLSHGLMSPTPQSETGGRGSQQQWPLATWSQDRSGGRVPVSSSACTDLGFMPINGQGLRPKGSEEKCT